MNKSTIGASAILDNLRKKMPVAGALDRNESLSSMMSNVSLSSYTEPRDGVVVASFKVATTDANVNAISDGIARLFKGEMSVVAGSMKVLEKSKFFTSVSAHLIRNTVTRAVGDSIPQGFISLSKNIFMEERDSKTWKLITTDDGKKILVRDNSVETDSDMEKLMSSLSSVNHQYTPEAKKMVAQASSLMGSLDIGVLVSYVTEAGAQALGFIVENLDNQGKVGIANEDGYVSVSANKIVHAFDLEDYYGELTLPKAEAIAGKVDVNVMLDYYKKVYGFNKDLLNKMLERIKANAIV